jgi:hypothetical protein
MKLSRGKDMKKAGNEVAIRREANLAAAAWSKLEQAAQAQLNGDPDSAPALQLVANGDGISALIRDEHGTSVVIQKGKISVNVEATQPD